MNFLGLNISLARKAKTIRPDDIEVLFHTEAAYHGEHGRLLVTNRAIGMVEKPIIFCLKGVSTPLPMNLRLFWHIWESAKTEGFIPLELLSYGNTIEFAEVNESGLPVNRQLTHMQLGDATPAEAQSAVGGVVNNGRPRVVGGQGFHNVDVPAFLRKQAEEGTGHETAGFAAASK